MSEYSHHTIDARLLRFTEAAVLRLDAEPALRGRLADNVSRWQDRRLREQWQKRLAWFWPELRARLLAPTEEGAALRQDAPLGGISPAAERTRIMGEFAHDATPSPRNGAVVRPRAVRRAPSSDSARSGARPQRW